ncbi:MAG: hypothetical protein ACR5LA_08870 [Wolbachia sp.]
MSSQCTTLGSTLFYIMDVIFSIESVANRLICRCFYNWIPVSCTGMTSMVIKLDVCTSVGLTIGSRKNK